MTREELIAKLQELGSKVTDEDLADNGRYFHDSCTDYAQCGHDETGNPGNQSDGELVELLWNGYRAGQFGVLEDRGDTSAEVASVAGGLINLTGDKLWDLVQCGFKARDAVQVDACEALAARIRSVAASALSQRD